MTDVQMLGQRSSISPEVVKAGRMWLPCHLNKACLEIHQAETSWGKKETITCGTYVLWHNDLTIQLFGFLDLAAVPRFLLSWLYEPKIPILLELIWVEYLFLVTGRDLINSGMNLPMKNRQGWSVYLWGKVSHVNPTSRIEWSSCFVIPFMVPMK